MARAFGSTEKQPDDGPREKSATERTNEANESARKAAARKREAEQNVSDLVVRQIVHPPGFVRVDAHHLFENRFRVNVIATKQTPDGYGMELSIAKSFFIETDGIEIASSIPPLE